MRNQILILAAGKGARMGSDIPKVLISLNQKPIILHLLHELEKINQLAKPIVVVGFRYQDVKTILGDGYTYALQERQLGTGHAVMAAKGQIKAENILVLYGDMPFIKAESLKKLMHLHHDQSANISMFTTKVENFIALPSLLHFGRIIRSSNGSIIKITEYKDATATERDICELNPGIYMFNTKWLFSNIHQIKNTNAQKEYYLTDIAELAIATGEKIHSLPINPKEVLGINNIQDLHIAENGVRSHFDLSTVSKYGVPPSLPTSSA